MKKLIKILFILLLVIVLAGVGVFFSIPSMGGMVSKLVNKYGSQVTGTNVTLGNFELSPLKGELHLNNLAVANPKNYSQPNVISIGDITVKIDLKTILSDVIVVDYVRINKPVISYEMLSITQNNVSQLLENINRNTASSAKQAAAATSGKASADTKEVEQSSKPAKKVIIKQILVDGGEINVAASIAGQTASAGVTLPAIELKNIGEDKNGADIVETATMVLKKILTTGYETVVKSQLVDLQGVAEGSLDNVLDSVKEKSGVKGWFGLGE